MNKLLSLSVAALLTVPAFADTKSDVTPEVSPSTVTYSQTQGTQESEFISDEKTEEGFLTHYLNNAIASGMQKTDDKTEVKYGRKVTDYVSAPKFGGYFIGKYAYSSQEGQHSGDGFSQRLIRFYVDGTILKHFAYRIQIQFNNASPHMKDYFVEWRRFPEFKVKIGQFKRAFGLENPMNPWDVGVGDYSQLTKKLTGHSDYVGGSYTSDGGRDQGLQIQGDLFPVGKDRHRLLHYQVMVSNGQGINTGDANSQKDITGTIQIQPVKDLFFGFMGWTGNYTENNITVRRDRYLFFAKYNHNDWAFRAEYAHGSGHKLKDYDKSTDTWSGTGQCDAWYVTLGIPCTKWLKPYLKYDVYRDQATWGTTKSIYSICPVINLHKNLMFQPQFNYVHDCTLSKKDYCELWVETYVRF